MTRRFFRGSLIALPLAFSLFIAGCQDYKAVDGASCTQASQCASNFCVDGFCCDSACSGTCRSCSAAVKGDGANGTCGPIGVNTDPDNECLAGACSGTGTCLWDNGGACVLSADCLSQHCIDGVCCDAQCDQSCYACSAAEKGNGVDGICGPVTANMDPNNECVSGNCDGAGVCANLAPNGTMCSAASECASNFCVDGFCCNQDCAESCNACNAERSEGTCIFTCTPPACKGTIGLPDPPIETGLSALASKVVAAVDLNGDGFIDIVGYNAATISVLLATGHNTFSPSVDYPSANFSHSGLAADLNGDNRPDLALASYGGNYVSVHINNGDGTFAPYVVYTVGSRSQSIAAADVNGDGQTDLITANVDIDNLSVLINNGNGTFAPKVDYPTNTDPLAVAAADFNGDGRMDLVTANDGGQYPDGSISVLLGNGNGTFAPRVDYSSTKPEAMVAADFTGDGKPDVAVLSDGAIVLHRGVGDGNFYGPAYYPNNFYYATSLDAADTDQDGDLDIVASTYRSGILTVYTNQNGSFATNTKIPTPGWGGPISVVDVTGDGKRDIVTGYDGVHVLPNLGNGTFPSDHVPDYGAGMLNPIAVDVNNDGKLDLVAPEDLYVQPSRFKVFINDGSGHFPSISTTASHNYKMKFVAASDFNGDGLQDLVTTHYGAVAILINQGNTTFGPPASVFTNASSIDAMTTGDFNGDGHVDLAYSSFNYTGGPDPARSTVLILLGNGDGTMAPSPVAISWLGSTGTNCHGYGDQLAVADLDNDGKSELVFASCNLDRIEVLKLTTNTLLESYGTAPVVHPLSVHLGDLDGDGLFDLVVGTATGASVLLRQSAFAFAAPVAYDRDGQIDYYAGGTVALGDMNNDGTLDLVTANRWNSLSVYFNQGNAVFAPPVDYFVGWNPRGTISRDFNGDGRDDLAFSANGKIGVALSKCLP